MHLILLCYVDHSYTFIVFYCISVTSDYNGTRLTTTKHYQKIYSLLSSFAHLWREIGLQLSFLPNELNVIQSNPVLMLQNPPASYLGRMLELWLQWAPGDGRGSKNFARFEDLQAALLQVNGVAAKSYELGEALGNTL